MSWANNGADQVRVGEAAVSKSLGSEWAVENTMSEGVYSPAELASTKVTAISLMELSENATVATRTHAAKPLGSGKKSDSGQMAWVHWHGNLEKLSMLATGFLWKNFRGFYSEIATRHFVFIRHTWEFKEGDVFASSEEHLKK